MDKQRDERYLDLKCFAHFLAVAVLQLLKKHATNDILVGISKVTRLRWRLATTLSVNQTRALTLKLSMRS